MIGFNKYRWLLCVRESHGTTQPARRAGLPAEDVHASVTFIASMLAPGVCCEFGTDRAAGGCAGGGSDAWKVDTRGKGGQKDRVCLVRLWGRPRHS